MRETILQVQGIHEDCERAYAQLPLRELPEAMREAVRRVHIAESLRCSKVLLALAVVESTGFAEGWAKRAIDAYAEAAMEAVDVYREAAAFVRAIEALAKGPGVGQA